MLFSFSMSIWRLGSEVLPSRNMCLVDTLKELRETISVCYIFMQLEVKPLFSAYLMLLAEVASKVFSVKLAKGRRQNSQQHR